MKKLFLMWGIFILIVLGIPVNAQESTKNLTVAILHFTEGSEEVKGKGKNVAKLMFAGLVTNPNIWLVERSDLDKILKEAELNLSGVVEPSEMTKVGQLTGAKILVTGTVFKVDNQTYIIAKVIGTETGKVKGSAVSGTESISVLTKELAKQVSGVIDKEGRKLLPKVREKKDIISSLKEKIGNAVRPSLFIKISERHIGQVAVDPAVQVELQVIAKKLGFQLKNNEKDADIVIKGEAFSELASRRGNLISVKARAEIKAVDKAGNIVAVDRQTAVDVGLAEQVTGKKALQEAGEKIAERLLPKLIQKR